MHSRILSLTCLAALLAAAVTPARADENTFASMSIEELLATRVTSVAGVENAFFGTPAALSVITRQDIDRAGHRSVPEALRLVPGTYVGQLDSNSWSVGTRGFNSGFGNKQLVLIDGRATYDLLFSGTFWDVQDVLLEDLDRIEVVRGPGATLWGANAVNGVINITTRSARETQGVYLGGGSGTYERLFGEFRYGASLGNNTWYRVWGKYFERDEFDLQNGAPGHDDWRMARSGFRVDHENPDGLGWTIQGDAYDGDIGELTNGVEHDGLARGHHLLGRLVRGDAESSGWRLQGYFDHTDRVTSGGFVIERDTVDVDFRKFDRVGDRHALIWGVGFQNTDDATAGTAGLIYQPAGRTTETVSAFVQDTLTLDPQRLFLMVGSKFEHNDFSGFEFQPSIRFWYTPNERTTLWTAVSRPVRTPSRTDTDLAVNIPGVFSFQGNPDLQSERLVAWEAGLRRQFTDHLTIDLAAFYNDYDRLVSVVGAQTGLTFDNSASAGAAGFEVSTVFQPGSAWRLTGSYSFLNVSDHDEPIDQPDGASPRHLLHVASYTNFGERLQLDAAAYYTGAIASAGISPYVRLDVGLRWRARSGLLLHLRGQNLLDSGHPEAAGDLPPEVPQAVYLELRLAR